MGTVAVRSYNTVRMLGAFACALALLLCVPPHIRSQEPRPTAGYAFEIASVKQNKSGGERLALVFNPDGFRAVNATVRMLVRLAYGPIQDNRIMGGPDWITSDRFDIDAKMSDDDVQRFQNLSKAELVGVQRPMLQALLADRFGLVVQRMTKVLPVYALVIAKNGPRLSAGKSGDTYESGYKSGNGQTGPGLYSEPGKFVGQGVDTGTLATMLSRQLDRIVLDETGLKGRYDFKLTWTPDQGVVMPTADPPTVEPSGPGLFEAVQQQLGLKLESKRAPIDVLLIVHLDKPSQN